MANSRGPKPQHIVRLTAEEVSQFQRLARSRKAPHAQVVRAKILLLAYEHPRLHHAAIGRAAGCTVATVRKWRIRSHDNPFVQEAARSGAPRLFSLGRARPGDRTGLHVAPRQR
jgi:hypothetical protein